MTRGARTAGGTRQRVLSAARTLRSPNSGVLGQGVRFVLAGGVVVAIYVTTTTVLADVVGLPFQVALAIGFSVALSVQFALYRLFVWTHHEEFALPMHHQAGRFLAAAGVNYGLTAASTSLLPSALGVPTEVVYLVTVATLPAINFLVLRQGIFHPKAEAEEPPMSAIEQTAALLAGVFPGSDISRPEYLRWLYEQSPFGAVIETNLDDESGRAGHYALVPITLSSDGADHSAALSLNTAVHERARGGGTFVRLASATIDAARRQGVEAVVGVANANSTPGFVRRLDFELLTPLPASVMLPTPGSRAGIRSGWADAGAFSGDGLAASAEPLLAAPASGQARRWTPETLRWRLARPGARYALHRTEDLLAISCRDSRHGIGVAVLLKVFAASAVPPGTRRALVRAACRFHRAPIALHVGLNELVDFQGVALPERLRESPLNLIYRNLLQQPPAASIIRFEFLDFDAY